MSEKGKTIAIWVLIVLVVILTIMNFEGYRKAKYKTEAYKEIASTYNKEEQNTKETTKQQQIEAREYIFENGNFTAGVDFEEGIYNVIAIEGDGTVGTINSDYKSGMHSPMGISVERGYAKEYKNVKLPKNIELQVKGVKIKLVRVR